MPSDGPYRHGHVGEARPVRLHARTLGERGPWILVLHGLFGSGRNWQAIGKALAATRRVCLVDLRNHGSSPWADAMTYPALAADVVALADHLGIETASLVGHSMGGKVAMWLALTAPARVERLAVVDIAPVPYAHDHAEHLGALRELDLDRLASRAAVDAALAQRIPDASLRQFLLQNLVRTADGLRWRVNLEAIAATMPTLTGFPASNATFGRPTLAIVGGASAYVGAAGERALQRHFPDLRLLRLPGVGHWPHAEDPSTVIAALDEFLAPLPERVRG